MLADDFRVEVVRKPNHDIVEVYLLQRRGGETYNGTVKDGAIVMSKIDETMLDSEITPFVAISTFLWAGFVRAVTNDLPNVSREEIDAELKATKYHLEDMRKLALTQQSLDGGDGE